MKKLSPINVTEPDAHEDIIANRGKPFDPALKAALFHRFSEFDNVLPNLGPLPPVAAILRTENNVKTLKGLYNSETATALKIKKDVRELEQKLCPSCGRLGDPGTIDHFLPISKFPEFALYYKNLVPSCGKCNLDKNDTVWDKYGNRQYINPYYDSFMGTPFFSVKIAPDIDGLGYASPLFLIRFIPGILTLSQIRMCKFHFASLGVSAMLRNFFIDEYDVLFQNYMSLSKMRTISPSIIREDLVVAEKTKTDKYGANNWFSLLYRAVLNDTNVIDYIARKV